ncbi:hypothetical protein RF11_10799 [Thelohanellus kitauei]|uniref:FAM192A/Fyv6 N-terminal domain-containing protein n=1 Tax=Thelohanellus kitauei TaxID=669202 RepID=A0A0C2N3G3_THEKT|nr:hypothetical protein RF11_10799 [Thelohanellus kitauei]
MTEEGNILTKRKFLTEKEALEHAEKYKDEVVVDRQRNALIEKPEGEKTLFEQLEENRNKMIDDFEEYFKLRNRAYSGLNEEERTFMIQLKQHNFKKAKKEDERIKFELEQFKSSANKAKTLPDVEDIKSPSFEIKPLKTLYPSKRIKTQSDEKFQTPKSPLHNLVTYSGSDSE